MKKDVKYTGIQRYYRDPRTKMVYKENVDFKDADGENLYYVTRDLKDIENLNEEPDYLDSGMLSFDSRTINQRIGEFLIRIRPSIKKYNKQLDKFVDDYGRIRSKFEYKVTKALDSDEIREKALKAGGYIKRQYIYSRIANAGEDLAITRLYVGSCNVIGGNTRIRQLYDISDKVFAESYAKSEVYRVDDRIVACRAYTPRAWAEKVKEMASIVERESAEYRLGRGRENKIEEYALGIICGTVDRKQEQADKQLESSQLRPRRIDRYSEAKIKRYKRAKKRDETIEEFKGKLKKFASDVIYGNYEIINNPYAEMAEITKKKEREKEEEAREERERKAREERRKRREQEQKGR